MSIVLHSTKGVNPRVTVCRNCGKDVGIALLGARDGVYTCTQCDAKSVGGRPGKDRPGHLGACVCPSCGARDSYVKERTLEDHEKLPIDLCDDCIKAEEACQQVVKEGGIFWRCVDCKSTGAIKGDAELAKQVRKEMGIPAPKPCGIEFSREHNCPVCSANRVDPDPNISQGG